MSELITIPPFSPQGNYNEISDFFESFETWFKTNFQKHGLSLQTETIITENRQWVDRFYEIAYPNGDSVPTLKGTWLSIGQLNIISTKSKTGLCVHAIINPNDNTEKRLVSYTGELYNVHDWSNYMATYNTLKDLADDFITYINTPIKPSENIEFKPSGKSVFPFLFHIQSLLINGYSSKKIVF